MKYKFINYTSGIQLPDYFKLAINQKNNNDLIIFWYGVIVKFSWRGFVSLVKFSYWSRFHVSIITSSGVFLPEDIDQKSGNRILCGICPKSGGWGELGIPNLARVTLIRCYWMLGNASVTAFTLSELLRENERGRGGGGFKGPQWK